MKYGGLVNLKKYKVVITSSSETYHGVSGHLFEMVEYFIFLRKYRNIDACILLSDGTELEVLLDAAKDKYDFDIESLKSNIIYHPKPKCIIANTILVVDGSLRFNGADIFAKKKLLFRCADDDIVRDDWTVLQDYDLYDDLPNSVHYKKKIFFDLYKDIEEAPKNTAMLYLTSNCRAINPLDIDEMVSDYEDYIVLTNTPDKYNNSISVPVNNMWSLFDTYIYTNTAKQFDCSPRFIMECLFYDKRVIYNIDYIDKGIQVRLRDGIDKISLKEDDEISSRI